MDNEVKNSLFDEVEDGICEDGRERFPKLAQIRPISPPDIMLGSAIGCLAAGAALCYMGFDAFGLLSMFLGALFATVWAIGVADGHLRTRRKRVKLKCDAHEEPARGDAGAENEGGMQDAR